MSYKAEARIGAYRLVRRCGGGAYGEVFVAENLLTGERVALKKLFPSPTGAERELSGLIRWRDCRHPNLLRILHVESLPDSFYYTMELADDLNAGTGGYLPDTLANRLEKLGRRPVDEVEKLAAGLTDALHFLHGRGFVHRDVKPDNILYINGVPTLGDAGLTASARGGSLVGTPEFMPAEVLQKKRGAAPADDFYALNRVLYCALTGELPGNYPHCPAGVLDERSSALWQRILSPADKAEHPPRRSRRAWRIMAAVLTAAFAATLFALWRYSARKEVSPPSEAKTPPPKPEPKFMLDRELPKLLAQYRDDDKVCRHYRTAAGIHSRKFYENMEYRRKKLLFGKEFGHLNDGEYAAALKQLDSVAAAGRERDVLLSLHECQLRLDEHLKRAVMYPIHAAGDLPRKAERDFYAEACKLLEERRKLLARLRIDPGLSDVFALEHSLWSLAPELKKEAPLHHWCVVAENPKLAAFLKRHDAELRQDAAQLPDERAPEKLKPALEVATAKLSGGEKLLYAVCMLQIQYSDATCWVACTPENIRFYAALFRLNRDLVERLYREYPQYRP